MFFVWLFVCFLRWWASVLERCGDRKLTSMQQMYADIGLSSIFLLRMGSTQTLVFLVFVQVGFTSAELSTQTHGTKSPDFYSSWTASLAEPSFQMGRGGVGRRFSVFNGKYIIANFN